MAGEQRAKGKGWQRPLGVEWMVVEHVEFGEQAGLLVAHVQPDKEDPAPVWPVRATRPVA